MTLKNEMILTKDELRYVVIGYIQIFRSIDAVIVAEDENMDQLSDAEILQFVEALLQNQVGGFMLTQDGDKYKLTQISEVDAKLAAQMMLSMPITSDVVDRM